MFLPDNERMATGWDLLSLHSGYNKYNLVFIHEQAVYILLFRFYNLKEYKCLLLSELLVLQNFVCGLTPYDTS